MLLTEELITPGTEVAGKVPRTDEKDNDSHLYAGCPEEMSEEGYFVDPFFQSTWYSAVEHQEWYADNNPTAAPSSLRVR